MHVHWRMRPHNTLHAHFEDVVDLWLLQQVDYHVALTTALCLELQRGVEFVQRSREDARVRKLKAHSYTLNVIGKGVPVLILEFQRDVHRGTQGEVQGLVHILAGHCEDVCYQHIQHDNLIAECLVFLYDDCDLAIFVESTDPFFVDKLDNGSLHILVLIRVSRVVIDTLLAVSESQPCPLVSLDLGVGIRGHQIKVCLLLWVVDELRNIDF
jgi:hypothetical protein